MAPPSGHQVFKYMSWWGHLLFKPHSTLYPSFVWWKQIHLKTSINSFRRLCRSDLITFPGLVVLTFPEEMQQIFIHSTWAPRTVQSIISLKLKLVRPMSLLRLLYHMGDPRKWHHHKIPPHPGWYPHGNPTMESIIQLIFCFLYI